MSVCSQMGNGQGKGGKKKKKDPVKEGIRLDHDPPSGPQDMENSDLQQEGLEQFKRERSRRRDVLRDLGKQSGIHFHDGGEVNLNASFQDDGRNIGVINKHVSSNEVEQRGTKSTVQVGKDPIGAFDDSGLVNGHVTGSGSDKKCGEIVTNESDQANHELVNPGLSPSYHSAITPGNVAVGTSDSVPAGVPGRIPGDAPKGAPGHVAGRVPGDIPKGAPGHVAGRVPGDIPKGAPGHVAGRVPGDIPKGAPGHVAGGVAGNVPVDGPGNEPGYGPGNVPKNTPSSAPGSVPDSAPSGAPCDIPDSAPGGAPRDVLDSAPGGAPCDVLDSAPGGAPCDVLDSAPGGAPRDVLDSAPGGAPRDVLDSAPGGAPCDVRSDIPCNGPANAPVEPSGYISGVPAQSGLIPNPPLCLDQVDSAQKKMPTTGDDTSSNNQEQTRKAPPQEQNDYQSIPPTPKSKAEYSSPSAAQIVSGLTGRTKRSTYNDAENLKVADQLVSKVVTDNTLLMDKLSKYLDRESRVIKCWKHLAYVLDVPAEERVKFDMYTEHSPTEDLFNFLADIWNPDLTVQELKMKLKKIHRNDLIEGLNREGFKDEMKVCDLFFGQPKFIKLLAPKLDIESRTIGNWKSLATEFSIRKQKTEQFGLRGSGPTGALFSYMQTADGLHDLTIGELRKHFEDMGRRDLVNLLTKQKLEGSWFVKDVLVDGSELLAEIGERLNKEIAAIKNWRNLAYRLNIPHETYSTFDTSKGKAKSPTKMMFEWLANSKPGLKIGDLLKGIKEIDRADVVEILTQEAETALKKVKKDREDSTQQHNFVDGATRQFPASQALHDLQQMHRDADKKNNKTTNFLSDLEKNANDRGFIVVDNPGEGDCMFYALQEQLRLVKGITLSAQELRKNLVQYLKEHPKLPDGTDLLDFTDGYPSWPCYLEKMAKSGTWGDHVILVAASNAYNTPICIVSSLPGRDDIIINPDPPAYHSTDHALVVGHVHEQHYVSLFRIQEPDDGARQRENPQVSQRNGQDNQYLQSTQYGEPPFSAAYANQQGNQQLLGHCQSQGYQQEHGPYQSQAYQQRQQGHRQLPGYPIQHQQECYQSQCFQQRRGFQPQQRDQQLQPLSKDHRRAMRVLDLPRKDVYSKLCVKLNIRRDLNFDDFRMVAEELGMDRETTEYAGQQRNPTDFIFLEYYRNVTVGELINILHKIERVDVAAVLEKWIEQGRS